MSRFVLKWIESGPDDLRQQLPAYAAILRKMSGPRRDNYWLARLDEPIKFHLPASFDRSRLNPPNVRSSRSGDFVDIRQIAISGRWPDTQLHIGMTDVLVNVAYVTDISVDGDKQLDLKKLHHVGVGAVDDISMTVAVPPIEDIGDIFQIFKSSPKPQRPSPTAEVEAAPLRGSGEEFQTRLKLNVARLASLTGSYPSAVPNAVAEAGPGDAPFYIIGSDNELSYHRHDPLSGLTIRNTTDPDELMYWIVDDLASELAQRAAEENPAYQTGEGGVDHLWLVHWAYLMAALDPKWGRRTQAEIDAIRGKPSPPVAPARPRVPEAPVADPAPTPDVMDLGAHGAALKVARLGADNAGAKLSMAPPKYTATLADYTTAVALVAALNDPVFDVTCEWACAMFQPAGGKPRVVVASDEGLSWIPPGLYMPEGVIVASADENVCSSIRKLWRGLRPAARVLWHYARAIGEEPILVVARFHSGLDELFSARTVVAGADSLVLEPNPLRNPAGRHRLEMASPGGWWPEVQEIPEAGIADRIRGVAAWLAVTHDDEFGQDPLRSIAAKQIGHSGAAPMLHHIEERMHTARREIIAAPITAPEPLVEGWNDELVARERLLRGWETLWLAQRAPTRATLADVIYAAAAT